MNQVDHWLKESRNISKPPPPYTVTAPHRTPNGSRTIQYSTQRGQLPLQDHQAGHVHLCTGPHPQQEPQEVPATSYTGPPSSCITQTPVQAFQPSNYTQPHLTPYPPTGSPLPHTLLPPSIVVGGTNIYGKYTCLSKTYPLHP